jgi:hypothetical protein
MRSRRQRSTQSKLRLPTCRTASSISMWLCQRWGRSCVVLVAQQNISSSNCVSCTIRRCMLTWCWRHCALCSLFTTLVRRSPHTSHVNTCTHRARAAQSDRSGPSEAVARHTSGARRSRSQAAHSRARAAQSHCRLPAHAEHRARRGVAAVAGVCVRTYCAID